MIYTNKCQNNLLKIYSDLETCKSIYDILFVTWIQLENSLIVYIEIQTINVTSPNLAKFMHWKTNWGEKKKKKKFS